MHRRDEPGRPSAQPWLQGERGFSRKGPQPEQASHYYSRPQLQVERHASTAGRSSGIAWFDHEWSTTVLDPAAAGWDWTGINLDDGSALVAFRIRRRARGRGAAGAPGRAPLWHYCALRHPDGGTEQIDTRRASRCCDDGSRRAPLATYPVAMRLVLPRPELRLEPLFDDQEIDGRAIDRHDLLGGRGAGARRAAPGVGLGYLELTGYHTPLKL